MGCTRRAPRHDSYRAVGNEIKEKCETMRPRKLSRSDRLTHFTSEDSPSSEKNPTPPCDSRLSVQELTNWPFTEVRNRLPRPLTRTPYPTPPSPVTRTANSTPSRSP